MFREFLLKNFFGLIESPMGAITRLENGQLKSFILKDEVPVSIYAMWNGIDVNETSLRPSEVLKDFTSMIEEEIIGERSSIW